MSVFQKRALIGAGLGVVIAGSALAGQVSVIPPTAIITPPPPAPTPVSSPPATAVRVPEVIGSFPVSAMSTSGLVEAAGLAEQAIDSPSLGPDQIEALVNLRNAINGELIERQ